VDHQQARTVGRELHAIDRGRLAPAVREGHEVVVLVAEVRDVGVVADAQLVGGGGVGSGAPGVSWLHRSGIRLFRDEDVVDHLHELLLVLPGAAALVVEVEVAFVVLDRMVLLLQLLEPLDEAEGAAIDVRLVEPRVAVQVIAEGALVAEHAHEEAAVAGERLVVAVVGVVVDDEDVHADAPLRRLYLEDADAVEIGGHGWYSGWEPGLGLSGSAAEGCRRHCVSGGGRPRLTICQLSEVNSSRGPPASSAR